MINLKNRFFEINNWKTFFNGSLSELILCDSTGNLVQRAPQIGDYIKVLFAKIKNPQKKDYQWARIDMIDKSNPERLMIQCRPSKIPGNEFAGKIAHYYSSEATITLVISKGKDYIKMTVYGRNKTPNTNTNFTNRIKNFFTALSGIFGSSKINWKQFADEMVKV